MQLLDWPSDGIVALLALVMYGVVLLALVMRGFRRSRPLSGLLPPAVAWHCVIWAFVTFWMLPAYSAMSSADAFGYHNDGMSVARLIHAGAWGEISLQLGSDTMPFVTGLLYAPFGGDIYGMLFFSAVLGLCAGLYFCLAFSLWTAPAQARKYSMIVLFLPSFAMWTSSYGKDSWIALGLGLAAYGYSLSLKARSLKGLWYLGLGVGIVTLIRPHIAVVLAMSMAFAYLWGLTRSLRGSIFTKAITVVLLISLLGFLASVAFGFLGLLGADNFSADSVADMAETRQQGNAEGGSAVEIETAPGVSGTLRAFPRGIVRVLFEPFPWEVHNFNAGLAAMENLFILLFALSGARQARGLLRTIAHPYLLYSWILTLTLLLMFSSIPNLGLLSRQRVQLLPFLFAPLVAAKGLEKRKSVKYGTGLHYSERLTSATPRHFECPENREVFR